MKRLIAGLLAWALLLAPALAADKTPLANYGGGAIPIKSGDTTPCVVHPALTGDVTLTAGTCTTAIGANKVTLGDIAQIGANTVLGNATGSTANAAAQSMPSCSTSTSALKWTTSTGFGCTAFGTFADQNYATPPAIGGTTPAAGSFSTLSATGNLTTNVTGSAQCLHANSSGVVSGTGSDCGSGGGGGQLGPSWTTLSFGSSESRYGATVYPSTATQTVASGQRLEVEAYLYKSSSANDASVYIGIDGTNSYVIKIQGDGNIVAYRNNGSTGTALIATGTQSANTYAGIHHILFVANVLSTPSNKMLSEINDRRFPFPGVDQLGGTGPLFFLTDTTFTLVGSVKVWVTTDDLTKSYVRARIVD